MPNPPPESLYGCGTGLNAKLLLFGSRKSQNRREIMALPIIFAPRASVMFLTQLSVCPE